MAGMKHIGWNESGPVPPNASSRWKVNKRQSNLVVSCQFMAKQAPFPLLAF